MQPPVTKPKSRVGRYVGIGCGVLSLVSLFCCATGGYVAWLDNRPLPNPGGAHVAEVAVVAHQPFTFPITWSGHGYEFQQFWLDVHGSNDLHLVAYVDCASGDRFDDDVTGYRYNVEDYEMTGATIHAHVRLGDAYLHSGESRTCTGEAYATAGTITAMQLYITERQRPSDYFAN